MSTAGGKECFSTDSEQEEIKETVFSGYQVNNKLILIDQFNPVNLAGNIVININENNDDELGNMTRLQAICKCMGHSLLVVIFILCILKLIGKI